MSFEISPPGGRPIRLADVSRHKGKTKPNLRSKDAAHRRWNLFNGFVDDDMAALTPADAAVWMVLFRHAKADGSVFASLETLAAKTGLHRRTVQRAIEHLEAAGHIVKVQRGGGCAATRYKLVRLDKKGAV